MPRECIGGVEGRCDAADKHGQPNPDAHTDEATETGQDDGLDEELFEDGAAGGANRFANPDLSGPFGDRDQHNVQDSDTADHERERRDGRGEQDEDPHNLIEGVEPASQRLHLEILPAEVCDVVAGVENAGYLGDGGGHVGLLRGLHGDLVHSIADADAGAEDVAAAGSQWHDRSLVELLSVGLHNTDDPERHMIDLHCPIQRRCWPTEQGGRDSRTQDHHPGAGVVLGRVEERPSPKVSVVRLGPDIGGADRGRRQERDAVAHDRRCAGGGWSDRGDRRCVLQRGDVGVGQVLCGRPIRQVGGLRHDGDVVGDRFDARIDRVLHPLAAGDQQDHRRDSDDEAKHGQRGAQPVST